MLQNESDIFTQFLDVFVLGQKQDIKTGVGSWQVRSVGMFLHDKLQ